jgi:regulator of protease activity HflC (stomatin/prohibitin superfamily)
MELRTSEPLRTAKQSAPVIADRQSKRDLGVVKPVLSLLFALALLSSFWVIVNPGERGVLMQFGKVQDEILGEELHFIIAIAHTIQKLSIRAQI